MWVKFVYSEIIPEKIVYTSFFFDEEGNVVRAPFNANWSLENLNTMTRMDRLGRNTVQMLQLVKRLQESNVHFVILNLGIVQEPPPASSFIGDGRI